MAPVAKLITYSALCAATVGLLIGCSAAKPKTEDFASNLAQYTGGYDIQDLRCESFANNGQEKSGRASCRGTLAVIFDLYEPMSREAAEAAVVTAGIPATGARWFRTRHPRAILAKSASQGAKTPFSAECSYSGIVDGWNVNCSTSYQRFPGQPLGSRGDNSIVAGTPEYTTYINEVLADYRRLDAAYRAVVAQIEAFFAPGRTVSTSSEVSGRMHPIRARIRSPLEWSGDRGWLGYQSEFSTATTFEDLRERRTGTFCGYPIGQPANDILFKGNIWLSTGTRSSPEPEHFRAQVEMMNRAAPYQSRFHGCTNYLSWNGTEWQGKYYSFALRSQ